MVYQSFKRIIDIIIAIILSFLFLPIWIIIPVLIKLHSKGPVLYKHKRMGKNGKEFYLYKFRTMVENADEILFRKDKRLLKKFKEGDWKLANDPRITKLGRFLRNLTIDEFPQLWNVLKGEMSIVGPRAYVRQEIREQTARHPKTRKLMETILSVKPGITGPWQTSGRNIIPFTKRAKIDYDYARRHSLWRDVIILLRTPKAMISKW